MKEYRLRPAAEGDLDDIWRYTATTWSLEQAQQYVSRLFDMFDALAENPARGQRADQVMKGYRRLRCGHHIIFYLKSDTGPIEVVRILHEKVDIRHHLDNQP